MTHSTKKLFVGALMSGMLFGAGALAQSAPAASPVPKQMKKHKHCDCTKKHCKCAKKGDGCDGKDGCSGKKKE